MGTMLPLAPWLEKSAGEQGENKSKVKYPAGPDAVSMLKSIQELLTADFPEFTKAAEKIVDEYIFDDSLAGSTEPAVRDEQVVPTVAVEIAHAPQPAASAPRPMRPDLPCLRLE